MAKRRSFEVFTLSFLDTICCGFGAVILFYTILSAQAGAVRLKEHDDLSAEVNQVREEVQTGERNLATIVAAIIQILRGKLNSTGTFTLPNVTVSNAAGVSLANSTLTTGDVQVTATGLLTRGAARIYEFGLRTENWDGQWLMLLASVPEANRHLRYRLRVRLEWQGFGLAGVGAHQNQSQE